ncbi:hypothetical protein PIB30_081598 [Stylosanthes scabra]|uniref:Uncharacterized protein n=1 Tax=Stylosanthes scabra TaxID=79078 RepID=A0ABU6URT1_9FABA|nr:hypothetical protein [Stylosanthes scabra]
MVEADFFLRYRLGSANAGRTILNGGAKAFRAIRDGGAKSESKCVMKSIFENAPPTWKREEQMHPLPTWQTELIMALVWLLDLLYKILRLEPWLILAAPKLALRLSSKIPNPQKYHKVRE